MTKTSSEKARLPAHHRPEGGFRNPWPSAQLHGFLDFLKWSLVERRRNPRRPDPDPAKFVRHSGVRDTTCSTGAAHFDLGWTYQLPHPDVWSQHPDRSG